jgi:hypothetical protein
MTSIIVRFPDGAKEFVYTEKDLQEGDLLWHDGEAYRVVSISKDGDAVAIVERVSDEETVTGAQDASDQGGDISSEIRAARNESVLRDLNERLEAHNEWLNERFAEWVCECANDECTTPVDLSIEEYERVRSEPARFLVAPEEQHVSPDVERVVQREQRYWVVEKIGIGAEVSEKLDPRS